MINFYEQSKNTKHLHKPNISIRIISWFLEAQIYVHFTTSGFRKNMECFKTHTKRIKFKLILSNNDNYHSHWINAYCSEYFIFLTSIKNAVFDNLLTILFNRHPFRMPVYISFLSHSELTELFPSHSKCYFLITYRQIQSHAKRATNANLQLSTYVISAFLEQAPVSYTKVMILNSMVN